MKILDLVQGTQEWHEHRAAHLNASDAPAMLGVSPYKSRAELLRECATGITPDIDDATQRRFNAGHRAEALARPLAEAIVKEELYPCVGVLENSALSASFDGLTMTGDVAFEHKLLSSRLREVMHEGMDGAELPEDYRVQMEQQCKVSGAQRVLFMASEWSDSGELIEERHCWYKPDAELRARIAAGWEQFIRDVAGYQPEAVAPKPVGKSPDSLPALRVEATGKVLASNLDSFRAYAMDVLGNINRDLKTDDDFANAEATVKWCKGVEDRLSAAKSGVLAQMQSVDDVCRTIDSISDETRRIRLELDRLVKAEKESRKTEIVQRYVDEVREHYASINASLGVHAVAVPQSVALAVGTAIKGRKTIASITEAASDACATLKIEASQHADRVRACIAVLADFADHDALFADRVMLCATKTPDDLRNLAKARIAEHQQREAARLEAERERIRVEEAAKVRAEAAQTPSPPVHEPVAQQVEQLPSKQAVAGSIPAGLPTRRIKLGDINRAIAPLSITEAGLAALGFHPCGTERAAKLYNAAEFDAMCECMAAVLSAATITERKSA